MLQSSCNNRLLTLAHKTKSKQKITMTQLSNFIQNTSKFKTLFFNTNNKKKIKIGDNKSLKFI